MPEIPEITGESTERVKSKYTDHGAIASISKKCEISGNTITIDRKHPPGIRLWGKIDYLAYYRGYMIVVV